MLRKNNKSATDSLSAAWQLGYNSSGAAAAAVDDGVMYCCYYYYTIKLLRFTI